MPRSGQLSETLLELFPLLVGDRRQDARDLCPIAGREVTVFGASKGRDTSPGANRSFAVTLFFKEGYDLELNVYNETFLSKVGKVFGQQDIQLGDEELDALVMIKGRDELAVKQLFDSQRVREQLLRMYAESKRFVIRDYGIRHEEGASNLSSARIQQLVEMMADLADALPER